MSSSASISTGSRPDALPHVIKFFAAQASLLRRKRRQLDEEARQWRAARAANAAVPPYPDTPNGRRARRDAERKARAIEIMRLAGRGWSSERIGRRFAISAGRVSQIIQQQLKLTRKEPAP